MVSGRPRYLLSSHFVPGGEPRINLLVGPCWTPLSMMVIFSNALGSLASNHATFSGWHPDAVEAPCDCERGESVSGYSDRVNERHLPSSSKYE
jgi:hypothetical protein